MHQVSPLLSAPPLLCDAASATEQPTATCTLGAHPESVKAGRNFTRVTLSLWGMEALTDVAELVVSELLTNAVRHGVPSARKIVSEHCVRLRLLAQAPFVMCMVTDPGHGIPVLRDSVHRNYDRVENALLRLGVLRYETRGGFCCAVARAKSFIAASMKLVDENRYL